MSQSLSTTSVRLAAVRLKSANKHIFRALLSLASAALLVRAMGMVNQVAVTARFGAGASMDAYFVASALPQLIGLLIVSAMESSVIPVYARVRMKGTKEEASRLYSTLLNLLIVGAILLSIVMIMLRGQIILLTAPALDAFRTQLSIDLALVIYPTVLLTIVIGFLECILNSEGQFGWPAYAGLLVPLTTATLVLTAGRTLGVVVLCVGALLGQCLQLCIVIIRARRAGLIYRLVMDLRGPEIATILAVAWPVLFGALISQAGPLVDQIFASFLSPGSISALSYALKIISVFSGVIFASVARAALPYFSRQASINDMKSFKATLRLYLWAIGLGTVVLTAVMIVLAHPLVHLLFQRGAFTTDDANRTAIILMGFVIGLAPMSIGFVTSKTFSTLGKTKVLMGVTTFSVLANALLDYIFSRLWGGFGIALATSAVYFCTMFILLITLRRSIGRLSLLNPPNEMVDAIEKLATWRGRPSFSFTLPYALRRQFVRSGFALVAFIAGAVGAVLNPRYALLAAFGAIVVLVLMRYRYALLIVCALVSAFIGSKLPVFSGNHLLTGLIVPTLLVMLFMPIKQTFKHMVALAFLCIYLVWVFASIMVSTIGLTAFLTTWITYVNFVAVSVLIINVLSTRKRLMALIDVTLLTSVLIALYGIYGYITKLHGKVDPGTALFRISSVFGSPPTLALFLSIVTPLALYRTFTLQGIKRVASSVAVIILLIALALTFTRSAFISFPLSMVIMILFLPSRKIKIRLLTGGLALAGVLLLLTMVTNIHIFNRFLSQDITTLNGRTYLWQAILDHFNPLNPLGAGLNGSNVLLSNLHIGINGRGLIATAPHDIFLGALYDHGIVGLALLVLVLITLCVGLIKGIRKTTGEHRMLFVTALAVFVSVLVQSLESSDLWIHAVGVYFWIVMALPFALCWYTSQQPSDAVVKALDEPAEVITEGIKQEEQEDNALVSTF